MKKTFTQCFPFLTLMLSLLSWQVQADNTRNKPQSWQVLEETDKIKIEYRYADCRKPELGTYQENVYLKVTNKTNDALKLEWDTEHFYNGKCIGCDSQISEYHMSLVLNPGQSKEGSCGGAESRQLRIFSKMLDLKINSELTDFNLKNLKVTPYNGK